MFFKKHHKTLLPLLMILEQKREKIEKKNKKDKKFENQSLLSQKAP